MTNEPGVGSIFSKIGHDIGHAVKDVGHAASSAFGKVEKIPVLGNIVHVTSEVYAAPFNTAARIASGARLDHVALGAFKDQLKIAKDTAPYAQTVVSFVPGIGTGVAVAIGAGAALAEGQNITHAAESAIRGALPGGPIAAAGFDLATKVASGENVAKATLESSRNLLPPGPAQQAFDIGLAVATGKKIQIAIENGLVNLAPAQLQAVVDAGKRALATTPGLAEAIKYIAPNGVRGFHLAAGLLGYQGVNERALTAMRNRLTAAERQGFDAALKTQEQHLGWLRNVTQGAPVTVQFTSRYAPYPRSGLSGVLSGPPPECSSLEEPVTNMSSDMQWAGRTAVNGSRGQPRMVRSPDGTDYLFAIENGQLTARRCVQEPGTGHGGGGGGHGGGHGGGGHGGWRGGSRGGYGGFVRRNGDSDWWWGGPSVDVTVQGCGTWGPPVQIPLTMQASALAALQASNGQPTRLGGYLFSFENGMLTARTCVS